ncbi:MAG: 50S ribosomal protein L29 [Parachlamydiales bacterium]|nr:50S ribosomal protein L29 [Parachlamydiales bacterium]
MSKAQNFKDQSLPELAALLTEAKKELFELCNQLVANKKLEKPHLIRAKKKDIARILTIQREKELTA